MQYVWTHTFSKAHTNPQKQLLRFYKYSLILPINKTINYIDTLNWCDLTWQKLNLELYHDLDTLANLWAHDFILFILWLNEVQGFVLYRNETGYLTGCKLRWLGNFVRGRQRWSLGAEGNFKVNGHTVFSLQGGCNTVVCHLQYPGNPQRLCSEVCLGWTVQQATGVVRGCGGRRRRCVPAELKVPALTWRLNFRCVLSLLRRCWLRCCWWYSTDKRFMLLYQMQRLLASNKTMQCEMQTSEGMRKAMN